MQKYGDLQIPASLLIFSAVPVGISLLWCHTGNCFCVIGLYQISCLPPSLIFMHPAFLSSLIISDVFITLSFPLDGFIIARINTYVKRKIHIYTYSAYFVQTQGFYQNFPLSSATTPLSLTGSFSTSSAQYTNASNTELRNTSALQHGGFLLLNSNCKIHRFKLQRLYS